MPIQQLVTKEVRKGLPALYANENIPKDDAIVVLKLFCPYGRRMSWWITEIGSGEDANLAFGYADLGMGSGEWGYIDIAELQELRVFNGRLQAVERDTSWTPKRWGDCEPRQREEA